MTTGEASEPAAPGAAKTMMAEKPMIVYVMSDDPTDGETRKLESVAFAREQVGVGAKFFLPLKITLGDASQDRILKDAGRGAPRLVFLKRDYTVASVLTGTELGGGDILKAMQGIVREEYVNKFDAMVRDYISLLNELDRLESKKAAIEDQKRRIAEKPNKSREKKVAQSEAEYKAEMAVWEEREKKILEFRLKGSAPDAET